MLAKLPQIVMIFVLVFIVSAIGFNILADQRDQHTAGSELYNETDTYLDNYQELTGQYDTVAIVTGAVVVLGIVGLLGFWGGKKAGLF